MRENDPYLILQPVSLAQDAPKKLLAFFETVRRASEWVRLGFNVTLDRDGFPCRGRSKTHKFSLALEDYDDLIGEAIRTGKKAVRDALPVCDYVLAGCGLDEFVPLSEDVTAYCQGMLLEAQGNLKEALPFLERACQLKPSDVKYREVYYPIRLELGDLSSIQEELSYFEHDIDSVIHSGRFDAWLKGLLAARDFATARQILSAVESALDRLVKGDVRPRYYSPQTIDWYAYKKEQFTKKREKYVRRMERLERARAHK